MNNLGDDSPYVSRAFGIVEGSELGWGFPETGIRGEDSSGTLSLVADNTTHCEIVGKELDGRRLKFAIGEMEFEKLNVCARVSEPSVPESSHVI